MISQGDSVSRFSSYTEFAQSNTELNVSIADRFSFFVFRFLFLSSPKNPHQEFLKTYQPGILHLQDL